MNDNKLRHKILRILSNRTIENDVASLKGEARNVIGISFDNLSEQTKCSDSEIRAVTSLLFTNKEVDLYDMKFKGLYITENGIAAYSTKKYIKVRQNYIIQIIKDSVQIFIPIISMIIALVAVSNNDSGKIDRLETELRKTQLQLTNMVESVQKGQSHTKQTTNEHFEHSPAPRDRVGK